MRIEKWQALGNDYIVLPAEECPFELTPARIRKICAPHFGVGSDGILLISPSDDPSCAAAMRIFNPDGSEAGLSGNGAREAIMYLRHSGRVKADQFSLQTPTGPVHATISSEQRCSVQMVDAALSSADYPSGSADGRGTLTTSAGSWNFQHVQVGNPQCSIAVADLGTLEALDLPAIGPEIERHEIFPNRTNVSWYVPVGEGRIRARIFERGVGETASSGTGAIGAAVASVLAGGSSPVTVLLDGGELEVTVTEDLKINLTGWAVPVFRGELADELIEELRATE